MIDIRPATSMTFETPPPPVAERPMLPIVVLAVAGIAMHLWMQYAFYRGNSPVFPQSGIALSDIPLFFVLAFGGGPLVFDLFRKLTKREFGSDLLAGISIIASVALHQYLAGALVVLMLSGGQALEAYAARSASSVLQALAKRMPTLAQRREGNALIEIPLEQVVVGDTLVVLPHALCPVDGTVLEGHGSMDESYLTGEPYQVSKAPGTNVLSGAINGEDSLTIRCDRPAHDSRYAKIMQVMRDSEQRRPHLRRLADSLGAWFTPIALAIAVTAWLVTGDSMRFLSAIVVATPCPLLIAIPTAIIGSISLAARRGILIKDPAALEKISECRTAIFDKTGTLTYGRPLLTEIVTANGYTENQTLALVASLERYSRHPLSAAIVTAAEAANVPLQMAAEVNEAPGDGLRAIIDGHRIQITGRGKLLRQHPELQESLPAVMPGMECIVLIDDQFAAAFRFRDEPRPEGARFIRHLGPQHGVRHVMLVSGDREAEVSYLAERVGITEVFASQSPENKLVIVRAETAKAPTLFLGDGINDAPALTAATVGVAFGANSDITGEAAAVVILDSSLEKADMLIHIGRRMRVIALQSAIGGMALSVVGMILAATGFLTPVTGAITQEVIDVLAVLNALRAAFPPSTLTDY